MHNSMACDLHVIEYCLENNRVTNNDTELQKNLTCFRTYRTDVKGRV